MSGSPPGATAAFWALLATERAEVAGGVALANTDVPLYLSNAAWGVPLEDADVERLDGRLAEVAWWYAARNLPAAVVTPRGSALEQRGWTLELSFGVRSAQGGGGASVVEEVSWAQLRTVSELLAAHYARPAWALGLSRTLVRAAQADDRIRAFLAHAPSGAPTGAMVTFADAGRLTAMLLADSDGALETRLVSWAQENALAAFVLEASVASAHGLERWTLS